MRLRHHRGRGLNPLHWLLNWCEKAIAEGFIAIVIPITTIEVNQAVVFVVVKEV